jgi:hypothetical protein
VLPEIEEDKVTHLIVCTGSGSNLRYAEKPAKLSFEAEVSLVKGGEMGPYDRVGG